MLERVLDCVLNPYFGLAVAVLILTGMVLHHVRQMTLIHTGLIKKPAVRGWQVDYEKLRGGLFMTAIGGVIVAAIYYQLSFWLSFWLLVCCMGVAQILASFLGRERWIRRNFR